MSPGRRVKTNAMTDTSADRSRSRITLPTMYLPYAGSNSGELSRDSANTPPHTHPIKSPHAHTIQPPEWPESCNRRVTRHNIEYVDGMAQRQKEGLPSARTQQAQNSNTYDRTPHQYSLRVARPAQCQRVHLRSHALPNPTEAAIGGELGGAASFPLPGPAILIGLAASAVWVCRILRMMNFFRALPMFGAF